MARQLASVVDRDDEVAVVRTHGRRGARGQDFGAEALRLGEQLAALAEPMRKSEDGRYLLDLLSSSDTAKPDDDQENDPARGVVSEFPIRITAGKWAPGTAGFSSRGPVQGLGQIKPDVSAPGVEVLAAVPPASLLGALAAAASPTSPNYGYLDGTSMASPHVAGAVALVIAKSGKIGPAAVRRELKKKSDRVAGMGGNIFHPDYGAGRLNLLRLLR